MGNEKILDKICNNFEEFIEDYSDFPLTEQAHNTFINFLNSHGMEDAEHCFDLESALYELEFARERQGFFYGFNLVMEFFRI